MVGVGLTALLAGGVALVASDERRPPTKLRGDVRVMLACATTVLSLLSVAVLVGNQALFAGREALARRDWASAIAHGRRAERILFWSHEPELVLGDTAAGLGDRAGARDAYREAVQKDPNNWAAWLRLAQVSDGPKRVAAYRRVHELNPREKNLPGE
jgi:tetratricopeptide (TPR) repeat protein